MHIPGIEAIRQGNLNKSEQYVQENRGKYE